MFDSFSYKYQKAGLNTVSNRLYHVNDDVSMTGIMSDDIDDEGVFTEENIQTANNYGYDEIGNLKFDKTEGIESIEWTAYGKVKSITRQANYYKTINDIDVYPSNLEFKYDAMGNRIAKIEKPRDANGEKSSADWKTTYYIRDAQGNPMATYKKSSETEAASFKLIEHPIYGSSRVGIDNYTVEFVGYTAPSSGLTSRVLGLKQYELTNHLGNVLTTISDKRIPVENNGVVDHYVADITTASDYYPFGSPMDGRTFYSEKYRFGFNGQEKDDEVAGAGNTYSFKYRVCDSRLGRFLSVDPLTKSYPWYTPYQFAGNMPILASEFEGLEPEIGEANYNQNLFFGNWQYVVKLSLRKAVESYNDPKLLSSSLHNMNWNPNAVKNMHEASIIVSNIKSQGTTIKNVFLSFHGGGGLISIVPDNNEQDITDPSFEAYTRNVINISDIQNFLQYQKMNDKDKASFEKGMNEETKGKFQVIGDLQNIINSIADGGNLVIGSCNSGADGGYLLNGLSKLRTEKGAVNICLSKDYITVKEGNLLDTPLSGSWDTSKEGEVKNLQLNSKGEPLSHE